MHYFSNSFSEGEENTSGKVWHDFIYNFILGIQTLFLFLLTKAYPEFHESLPFSMQFKPIPSHSSEISLASNNPPYCLFWPELFIQGSRFQMQARHWEAMFPEILGHDALLVWGGEKHLHLYLSFHMNVEQRQVKEALSQCVLHAQKVTEANTNETELRTSDTSGFC